MMKLQLKPPIPDLLVTGRDDRANSLSIVKRTGLGQMPMRVGEIGWFGQEYIHTMMVDCGCDKGDECEQPSILYVELLPDNGYTFYYDEAGSFVVCEAQNNVLQAKLQGYEDVFAYLDAIQNEYRTLTEGFEGHVQPSIDALFAAKTNADLRQVQKTITSLPGFGAHYVLGRMNAAAGARYEYCRRRLITDAYQYVDRVNGGESPVTVLADMKSAGIDPEVIQLLDSYAQAQASRLGDSSGWSAFKSTGTIH
jgi:hypothetical protein